LVFRNTIRIFFFFRSRSSKDEEALLRQNGKIKVVLTLLNA